METDIENKFNTEQSDVLTDETSMEEEALRDWIDFFVHEKYGCIRFIRSKQNTCLFWAKDVCSVFGITEDNLLWDCFFPHYVIPEEDKEGLTAFCFIGITGVEFAYDMSHRPDKDEIAEWFLEEAKKLDLIELPCRSEGEMFSKKDMELLKVDTIDFAVAAKYTVNDIATMFGITPAEVNRCAREHGCTPQ